MVWREDPSCDNIKHSRMQAWVYCTGKNGEPSYEVECFRWYRPSKHAKWQKIYRYNHERDFHNLARCLEEADRWVIRQQGRETPEPQHVEFSLPEVAAILPLLGSVRGLDTESPALWEFEKRVRAALGACNTERINEAVSVHEESELYVHIEEIRKKLP
jgi:hypothetical protein